MRRADRRLIYLYLVEKFFGCGTVARLKYAATVCSQVGFMNLCDGLLSNCTGQKICDYELQNLVLNAVKLSKRYDHASKIGASF